MGILRPPLIAGHPDVCLSTLEARLELSEVRRPVDYPRLHKVLMVEPTENLAAGTGGYTVTEGINAWTDEAGDYDPNNPTYSHFTQVVWKSTTELGCAMVDCPAGSIFPAEYGVRTLSPTCIR